jgi:hypothetical protein
MELNRITEGVTGDLRRAGAVGGEETARIAELLVAAVDSSVRLHLLEALYEAGRELEASAPGLSVDIRLEGRDPVLAIVPADRDEPGGSGASGSLGGYAGDELARLTLRLPEGLKLRVEHAAAEAGASVNAWIVAALARVLDTPPAQPQPGGRRPTRITGFVRG